MMILPKLNRICRVIKVTMATPKPNLASASIAGSDDIKSKSRVKMITASLAIS